MGKYDIAITIYIIIMVIGFFISYKYGSFMIRKTGLFFPQLFIAGAIITVIDVLAIIGWWVFSWGTDEALWLFGILLGIGFLVISEVILIVILLIKRKRMMQIFNESVNNNT